MQILKDLSHLLFPESCIACQVELSISEEYLCVFCHSELHYTGFEKNVHPTPLDRLFWGRITLHASYSLLYFQANSPVQSILHRLKYQHNPDIARVCGEWIGEKLSQLPKFHDADGFIPVPLHPKKQFERGFNQSEMLAQGISKKTGIPVQTRFLTKIAHTESQTRQGRFGRWENIKNGFNASGISQFVHLVIVDDVITTGATIESMVKAIHEQYPSCQISIVSLAFASSI
jgi:competence protein ComFC